jgi:hypothetical protein
MPESDETSPESELGTSTESTLFNNAIRSKLTNEHRALKTAIMEKASLNSMCHDWQCT